MRRVAAAILFVLGGWILCAEILMAWVDIGQTAAVQLGIIAFFCAIAAVPLLIGTWATPGNRWAELGLTILIAAAVGAAVTLTMFVLLSDPKFVSLMPSDRPVPHFKVAIISGLLNLAVVAATGGLLYQHRRRRRVGAKPGA